MENSESILTELKKISYLLSKNRTQVPNPIYLNQKEGAALLRIKATDLAELTKKGLINRFPRHGQGFVYKIKELVFLADQIDNGAIKL